MGATRDNFIKYPRTPLLEQWTSMKRPVLEAMLGGRFILYGEWLYAKHSVHCRKLPHYFFEFDIGGIRR